jgi:hypothetical protein
MSMSTPTFVGANARPCGGLAADMAGRCRKRDPA